MILLLLPMARPAFHIYRGSITFAFHSNISPSNNNAVASLASFSFRVARKHSSQVLLIIWVGCDGYWQWLFSSIITLKFYEQIFCNTIIIYKLFDVCICIKWDAIHLLNGCEQRVSRGILVSARSLHFSFLTLFPVSNPFITRDLCAPFSLTSIYFPHYSSSSLPTATHPI